MTEGAVDILLVEDSSTDLELTLHVLRRYHFTDHIVTVRDGAAALDFLFGTGIYADRDPGDLPSLVLLDLKLPKVDGLEVLQRIKADRRTRIIPVVVLTSSQEEQDLVESYHLGVNSYIVKPVDFEQFTKAVQQLGLYWLLLNQMPAQ